MPGRNELPSPAPWPRNTLDKEDVEFRAVCAVEGASPSPSEPASMAPDPGTAMETPMEGRPAPHALSPQGGPPPPNPIVRPSFAGVSPDNIFSRWVTDPLSSILDAR